MNHVEVKCLNCGWIHAAIPLSSVSPADLESYLKCVQCGAPSRDFVAAGRYDAPVQRSQVPYNWSRIYICLRAPLSVRSATVFEVVTEAYEINSDGSYLFKLENGLSFISDEGHEQGVQPCPKELRLVYAQQR